MRRLFSFGRKSTPPPRVPSVSEGVAGWTTPTPYPTPQELTQMMPGGIYQFDLMIGQGGMGAVYRGRQLNLERAVAVKILHRQHGTDYAYGQRFRREAQSLAQMNHPNIVSVYDFGIVGDYLFYVMEYIEGIDLHQSLCAGPLSAMRAIEILVKVCDALAYAHSKGIVHRDIKPANILLSKDGRIKVADFGLAKRVDPQATMLTQTNMAMGTPDYAAPEQYDAKSEIDHRADIYALGVMFYQMLTGQIPRGAWHPPSSLVSCDARLDAIITRALKPDRNQRQKSAEELKGELLDVLASPPQGPATAAVAVFGAGTAPGSAAAMSGPAVKAPTGPATSAKPYAGLVLLLEDDVLLRNLMVRTLRKEGYEVSETADGSDTVKAYSEAMMARRPFDLVLVDLTIPLGMGGARAMQLLRQVDPEVDAIVSSGNRSDPAMLQPSAHGFADVLPKPYDSEDLVRVVKQVLERRQRRLAKTGA
ncbi:MAG: Serine/threonine-protein kinase PknD [Prosthecobacter sp.]|nr:Serine/threonine-protein kinase PknD [Prosthecobacter sp.]